MNKIELIVFDLGGVVVTLDQPEAIRRFKSLGVADAVEALDTYTQMGIFGELEEGRITAEEFRSALSVMAGRELTWEDCRWAWLGYRKDVPQRNLDMLDRLRCEGYRLALLSNTNPYMMSWACSPQFSPDGRSIADFFDALYLSYEQRLMKPSHEIFQRMLAAEDIEPIHVLFVDDGPRNCEAANQLGIRTFCPKNGVDWTEDLTNILMEMGK